MGAGKADKQIVIEVSVSPGTYLQVGTAGRCQTFPKPPLGRESEIWISHRVNMGTRKVTFRWLGEHLRTWKKVTELY